MSSERDRALLEQVIHEVVVREDVQVEWQSPGSAWSAHVRLDTREGRACHLLSGAEWQEIRFEDPRYSAFITTTTDEDDVRDALSRLAQAAVTYLSGGGRVERKRGLLGKRWVLVLPTPDGTWRIGKRGSSPPRMADGGSV